MKQAIIDLLRLSLILAGVITFAGVSRQAIAAEPQQYSETGNWYQLVTTPESMSWTDCWDSASTRNGYLATIHDSAENVFILSLALEGSGTNTRLGGSKAYSGGIWEWLSGEAWNYENWDDNAPNPNPGNDYLMMWLVTEPGRHAGKWFNFTNTDPAPVGDNSYIIEYDGTSFCDDFEDGSGFLSRWKIDRPLVLPVGSPVHTGDSALSFGGPQGYPGLSWAYRKNFLAAEGDYSGWFYQTNPNTGGGLSFQVQHFPDSHPQYRPGYAVSLNAGAPTFWLIRSTATGDGHYHILDSLHDAQIDINEWIYVFARRLPNDSLVAGYENERGVRDSIICVDTFPDPIYLPGRMYVTGCDGSTLGRNVWDDVCYTIPCPDRDEDGICDDEDNCPDIDNEDQADSDCDNVGDVCDNCPDDWNPYQTDSDGDGNDDACDPNEWRVEIESKAVYTECPDVKLDFTFYWAEGLLGVTVPIVVRTIEYCEYEAGAFWVPPLPYDSTMLRTPSVGVGWTWPDPDWPNIMQAFRPVEGCSTPGNLYDGVSPDNFVIQAQGTNPLTVQPGGWSCVTIQFGVNEELGGFVFDTACATPYIETIHMTDEFGIDHGPFGTGEVTFKPGVVSIVECDCSLHCDVNLDGGINPIDVVIMVNCVYKDDCDAIEDNPVCPGKNGDWNCDGRVNPVDVVHFVNYVYKGIGAPCDPCECDPYPDSCPGAQY